MSRYITLALALVLAGCVTQEGRPPYEHLVIQNPLCLAACIPMLTGVGVQGDGNGVSTSDEAFIPAN